MQTNGNGKPYYLLQKPFYMQGLHALDAAVTSMQYQGNINVTWSSIAMPVSNQCISYC
jgi:hypothetical protein